jgi:hypothetical protein
MNATFGLNHEVMGNGKLSGKADNALRRLVRLKLRLGSIPKTKLAELRVRLS